MQQLPTSQVVVLPSCRHGVHRLSGYTKEEIAARVQTYFKFIFVRHPITRLVSAFKNKFGNERAPYFKNYGTWILHHSGKVLKPKEKNQIQFNDFLSYLFSTNNPLQYDGHFVRYDHLCSPCAIQYDFIGKQETYEHDSYFLLSTVFKRRLILPISPHATHSHKKTAHKMFVNISETYKNTIKTEYADDFNMFGYSWNGYM